MRLRSVRGCYLPGPQRTLTFTGIKGTGEQDFSVQEGMGIIVDRSQEHLGTTDIGIIAMRRRLRKDAIHVSVTP